jgi:DNA segregation ATPase FtsK/SpoIIIE-like protein
MKTRIKIGKSIKEKDQSIDLEQENLRTILFIGGTGSGKSIFHYNLYKQLMEQDSPKEPGFIFLDMT